MTWGYYGDIKGTSAGFRDGQPFHPAVLCRDTSFQKTQRITGFKIKHYQYPCKIRKLELGLHTKQFMQRRWLRGEKKAPGICGYQMNWDAPAPRNIAEDGRSEKQHQRNYLLKHQAKDKRGKALKYKVLLSLLGSERQWEINTMTDMASVDVAEIF